MIRIVILLVLAAGLSSGLASCGMIDTLIEGWKHVKAVETDLEKSAGSRPEVGFNWSNGRLTQVTVTFPGLYNTKPLPELAALVRRAVAAEFQQTPRKIVLGFAIDATDASTASLPLASATSVADGR
jgi:hypothetical protein